MARIASDFATKFGIPRQSGLVPELQARVVFEPEFRNHEAVRGLDGFSHVWLIWEFSEAKRDGWRPTVRPPRLGGETRMGVFATRSPFRPNSLGLSSVQLLEVLPGPELVVAGADLLDGTPIFDIKPYVPGDVHPDADFGYLSTNPRELLQVVIPEELLNRIPPASRDGLVGALAQDPRPPYQHDPERTYGMMFAGVDVRFRVADRVLTVHEVVPS